MRANESFVGSEWLYIPLYICEVLVLQFSELYFVESVTQLVILIP